jgi:hypothetical protein
MPRLLIRITKRSDGGYVIACERPDGTVTWQRGADAAFFPVHDLTHYAVETELRHRRGFFGLVAEGWDFTDFSSDWPRGRIPADAEPAELIVGLLDSERTGGGGADGAPMSAAELNLVAARSYEQIGCNVVPPAQVVALTDEQVARIRDRLAALKARWESVPMDGSLELTFEVA